MDEAAGEKGDVREGHHHRVLHLLWQVAHHALQFL
jgi:hypothetical protein